MFNEWRTTFFFLICGLFTDNGQFTVIHCCQAEFQFVSSVPVEEELEPSLNFLTYTYFQPSSSLPVEWQIPWTTAKDGQLPSPRWSPIIQNIPKRSVVQAKTLAPRLNSQNEDQVKCHGWPATIPRMVTHHPEEGHPQSKIYQKELYNRHGILHLGLTNKI